MVVAYIKDIVDPELVEEVENRIKKIDIDNVPESGYVEQLIEDNYLSPFPQVQNTERPDRVIAALMEGRVAILLDGTPFALIVPVTFSMMLQSPEDYYERWIPGTFIRMLRYLAAILALFTPALYIAFISFHPGIDSDQASHLHYRNQVRCSVSGTYRSIIYGSSHRNFEGSRTAIA